MNSEISDSTNTTVNQIAVWEKLAEKFSIMPLNGKTPIENDWGRWSLEKRPFSPAEFAGKNAGIVCGPSSGVLVLDVDKVEAFEMLKAHYGWEVPKTRTVKTGKGFHYYFKYPSDGFVYGSKSPSSIDPTNPGVKIRVFDIKGNGGQIVAEGSIHPETKQPYELIDDAPLADVPAWILALYDKSPKNKHQQDKVAPGAPASMQPVTQNQPEEGNSISTEDLPVSDKIKSLILNGKPVGERSEGMMEVMIAMVANGCPDDLIYKVMDKFAIGEKYRGIGNNQKSWLTPQIQNAKRHIANNQKNTKEKEKESPADILFRMTEDCHLFNNQKEGYIVITTNDSKQVFKVGSADFTDYLRNIFWSKYQKALSDKQIKQFLDQLNAKAIYSGKDENLFSRHACHEGHIYIDLGDGEGRVVDIHPGYPNGWCITKNPPVNFLKPPTMLPLPVPETGGSIEDFRSIINCQDDSSWKLVVGWLLGALNPYPPYPLLVIHGEQGSAKSNLAKMCKRIIDPTKVALNSPPKDKQDLAISAGKNWVLCYDNLSSIPTDISDALCRLSTGGGFTTRILFTNDGEYVFEGVRPIILTGINNVIKKPDLMDRSILLELKNISSDKRKPEREIESNFQKIYPKLLGSLYTIASQALKNLESVDIKELPRMADFTKWVAAAEEALGWKKGDFMKAYSESISSGAKDTFEDYPLAQGIAMFMEKRQSWYGTSTELFDMLRKDKSIPEDLKSSEFWPKAANAMSRIITTIATVLRGDKGIDIQRKKETQGSTYTITNNNYKEEPKNEGK